MRPYKTLTFGPGEIPAGLLRDHNLRAWTWGRLRVTCGALTYVDDAGSARLEAGDTKIIEPERLHHIEPGDGTGIQIEFYDAPPD